MALRDNPTNNQLVKEVKRLEEAKQDTLPNASAAGKVLKSTNTTGGIEWADESGLRHYVISYAQTGPAICINSEFNSTADYITLQTTKMLIDTNNAGYMLIGFKVGEIVCVVESGVPDRFVSSNSSGQVTFRKLETSGGGTPTDVKVDGTSITSNNEADLQTINGDYNASTNKLATEADLPASITITTTSGSQSVSDGSNTLNFGSNAFNSTTIPTNTNQLTNGAGFITSSDISGKEDSSNKVTSISSSSTDTEYPSAKLLYDKITDVAEIAEGKTANYVISDATTGTNVVNNVFGLTSDSMMIPQEDRKIIDINGNEIPLSSLKTGDIISVVETDVPDRWVGSIRGGYVYVYKLETKLNIDSSPTSGSTNPVSSGGVYSNTISDITYDSTNKKLQKTKGGTTSDVVTFGANAFTDTTIPTTYVSTVNGSSGAITNVAVTNANNNFSTAQTVTGNVTATKFIGGLDYLTTAPSAANTDGLKIVVLSSEPATRYSGYIYIITE